MHGSWSFWWVAVVVLIQAINPGPARGEEADNALSAEEKKDGWLSLFDGKSLNGWQTSSGQPSKVPIEDGCINPHGSGGYMMIHQRTWANFVLWLDLRISKGCNSGVFIRTYPLNPRPGKDVGFNGIEVAIDDTKTADFHTTKSLGSSVGSGSGQPSNEGSMFRCSATEVEYGTEPLAIAFK
jgi:Domain of Unknown Function (DUF1080)